MIKAEEKVCSAGKGKHITVRQRYEMEYMLKEKKTIVEIAEALGKSRSTIYRELKRGMTKQLNHDLTEKIVYLADVGQREYDLKKHEKGRYLKIGNDMQFVRFVEQKIIQERYSPQAVLYALRDREDIRTRVCHRTLYKYIHMGIFLNVSSNDLPYKVSRKTEKERIAIAKHNIKGRSIEERPKRVFDRNTFGNWEMDTVYSAKNTSTSTLLVLTERMTREEEIYYMKNRTQNEVVRVLNDIENRIGFEQFSKRYKTITCDNGVEFLKFDEIENSVTLEGMKRTTLYYCHPFASCERGSNENQNKLIRRWIKKGEDIANYIDDIPFIQDWINNYPRKLFGGMSTNDLLRQVP